MLSCYYIILIKYGNLYQKQSNTIMNDNNLTEAIRKLDLLNSIIEEMPANIYWTDKEGMVLGCNKNVLNLHGIKSKEDYVGKTYDDLFEKEEAQLIKQTDFEIMRSGKAKILEEVAIKSGKIVATYLTHKAPLFDNHGKVVGLLGVSIDITEKKKAEQELQEAKIREKLYDEKLHAMRSFAGSIAHELRTPLASIYGVASMMQFVPELVQTYQIAKDAGLSIPLIRPSQLEAINESLNILKREANYASLIIDLSLNNIKNLDKHIDNFKNYHIIKCVREAINRYPYESEKQQTLIQFGRNNQDFVFYGDELLLNHLLFNLIKNALYFINKAGKGEITIWTEIAENANYLYFMDTGIGMDETTQKHAFDHFFSKTENGTGLGLAFCKMVMQNMNGDIKCRAKKGEFTEFCLIFPKIEE